jgi:hypothetical protein
MSNSFAIYKVEFNEMEIVIRNCLILNSMGEELAKMLEEFSKISIDSLWRRGEQIIETIVEGEFEDETAIFHFDQLPEKIPAPSKSVILGRQKLDLVAYRSPDMPYQQVSVASESEPFFIKYDTHRIENPVIALTRDGKIFFNITTYEAEKFKRLEEVLNHLIKEYTLPKGESVQHCARVEF